METETRATGIGLLILIIIGVVLYNSHRANWYGVYISPTTGQATITDKFQDKEACLDWLHNGNGSLLSGAECGSNCKYSDSGVDIYKCSETID